MPEPISFGKLDFELTASMEQTGGKPAPETPFQIALLGDFCGHRSRGENCGLFANPAAISIDRDNFDEVMQVMGVAGTLDLSVKSAPITIEFSELDAFHPDSLFTRLEIFQTLKKLRRDLNNPDTFAEAAAEVRSWLQRGNESTNTEATVKEKFSEDPSGEPLPVSGPSSGDLLEQIISETKDQDPTADHHVQKLPSELGSFLRDLVAPYVVPADNPQLNQLVAAIDDVISGIMRSILHHRNFQEIEAAWRAVSFLVSRLETGTDLKLLLFDISKEELAADLLGANDLKATAMYRIFVEQAVETFGGTPWAVLAGNFVFDATKEDVEFLGRMAKIANKAGAPFLAQANEHLLGCESLALSLDPGSWKFVPPPGVQEAWQTLRSLPESSSVGLILPRFLLRMPYGEQTDPLDMFDFEECSPGEEHRSLLWGNPVFAVSFLLGRNFNKNGWQMHPATLLDLQNLPLHLYKEEGETKITPCAEYLFTEKTASFIIDRGFMPLLSFLNQDRVRLGRFQSIAHPAKPLKGPWG